RPGAGAIALGRGGRDHLGGDPARGVTDEELLLAEKYRRRVAHAVSRLRCTHPAADGSRRVAKAARVRVFPESVDLLCVLCFYFWVNNIGVRVERCQCEPFASASSAAVSRRATRYS